MKPHAHWRSLVVASLVAAVAFDAAEAGVLRRVRDKVSNARNTVREARKVADNIEAEVDSTLSEADSTIVLVGEVLDAIVDSVEVTDESATDEDSVEESSSFAPDAEPLEPDSTGVAGADEIAPIDAPPDSATMRGVRQQEYERRNRVPAGEQRGQLHGRKGRAVRGGDVEHKPRRRPK